MNVNVTTEIDEKNLLKRLQINGVECDNIKNAVELAVSTTIQKVLKQHIEDDTITIVLSTVPAYPHIQDSTEVAVNYVSKSDTYLIHGDNKLCKDLKSKIGLRAKIFGN